MSELLSCPMCSYTAACEELLLRHVCQIHEHDPNFLVYCSVCSRSFTKLDSFRKHKSRSTACSSPIGASSSSRTPRAPTPDEDTSASDNCPEPRRPSDPHTCSPISVPTKWQAASFILSIKEKHILSQAVIDTVVSSTTSLVDTLLQDVLTRLREELPEDSRATVDAKMREGVHLFSGLETAYLQKKYFRESFELLEPHTKVLGSRREWRRRKGKRCAVVVDDTFQYIPLLKSLKQLVTQPDVLDEVVNGHSSTGGVLRDFCDGEFFKNHPMISCNPQTLVLGLFYDDLGVVNPLGSRKKKHKLGLFYWVLLNVHPYHRSSLRFIQLLAVAKSIDIHKYGIDAVLEPTINDLQILANDGIHVSCGEEEYHFHGCLLAFFADTPAAGCAGGFKESASAYRKCRSCLVLPGQLQTKFNSSAVRLRQLETHKQHCQLQDTGMPDHFSKKYGINRLSILDKAPHFDVCQCLPHDIMHVLFEGVLVLHCRKILTYCIKQKGYFSLGFLNSQLQNFQYGYSDSRTIPSPIDADRLVNDNSTKLGQSASQMWLLGRLLPLMVGKHVPEGDKQWKCYIQLLRITTLATSSEVTEGTIHMMTLLVEDYLRQYTSLHPDSMVPKLHYLIHLPQQMKLFGPLRNQWCMRFEGKNAQIKSFVGKNFKNVPYTVATQHQYYMCMQLNSAPGMGRSNFLYKGDEIGKGFTVDVPDFSQELRVVIQQQFPSSTSLQCASTVSVLGVEFRPGALVCLESPSDFDYPVFGEVIHIIISVDNKICLVRLCETTCFSNHFYAYCITPTDHYSMVDVRSLKIHEVYHKYYINSNTFVSVRSCHIVELDI